jgi:hypothetical protein
VAPAVSLEHDDALNAALRTAVVVIAAVLITGASAAGSAPPTARQLVLGLRSAGLPIGKIKVYTAATDGSHLLGRPGGYVGKVSFRDERIHDGGGGYSVASGGSVEVFASTAAARRRAAFVASIFASSSPAVPSEHDYLRGSVFLRLSHVLTPAQVRAYVAALRRLA